MQVVELWSFQLENEAYPREEHSASALWRKDCCGFSSATSTMLREQEFKSQLAVLVFQEAGLQASTKLGVHPEFLPSTPILFHALTSCMPGRKVMGINVIKMSRVGRCIKTCSGTVCW